MLNKASLNKKCCELSRNAPANKPNRAHVHSFINIKNMAAKRFYAFLEKTSHLHFLPCQHYYLHPP